MDDNKIEKTPNVPPFVQFVCSSVPQVYDDSLSYYEALSALWAFIENNVVGVINNNASVTEHYIELTEEYMEQFNELHDYVENYFENLDVQDEIDHKLDEMALDGTLQALIESFAVDSALSDESEHAVQNKVITNKFSEVEQSITDAVDTIDNTIDGIQDDITDIQNSLDYEDYVPCLNKKFVYEKTANSTHTKTTFYYAIVDSEYKPSLVLADPEDVDATGNASEVAAREKSTLLINAGRWSTTYNYAWGVVIVDHELKKSNNVNSADYDFLGIDDDGILHSIAGNTSTESVEALGYKDVLSGFYKLYDNNVDYSLTHDNTVLNPRSFIAQNAAGDYLIGACSGRSQWDTGASANNIVDFIQNELSFGATIIYMLDGGGSSQLFYRGIMQNPVIQNQTRDCVNYLTFTNPKAKNSDLFKNADAVNKVMIDDIINYQSSLYLARTAINNNHAAANVSASAESAIQLKNNICIVNLSFTTSAEIAGYKDLFTGLPIPFSSGGLFLPLIKRGASQAATETHLCYIDGEGRIRTRFTLPAGDYGLNVVYSCSTS